jgi:hypothetical protein
MSNGESDKCGGIQMDAPGTALRAFGQNEGAACAKRVGAEVRLTLAGAEAHAPKKHRRRRAPSLMTPPLRGVPLLPPLFHVRQERREQPDQGQKGAYAVHRFDAGGIGDMSQRSGAQPTQPEREPEKHPGHRPHPAR